MNQLQLRRDRSSPLSGGDGLRRARDHPGSAGEVEVRANITAWKSRYNPRGKISPLGGRRRFRPIPLPPAEASPGTANATIPPRSHRAPARWTSTPAGRSVIGPACPAIEPSATPGTTRATPGRAGAPTPGGTRSMEGGDLLAHVGMVAMRAGNPVPLTHRYEGGKIRPALRAIVIVSGQLLHLRNNDTPPVPCDKPPSYLSVMRYTLSPHPTIATVPPSFLVVRNLA